MSRTRYPTDLADAQWKLIEPYVPRPKPGDAETLDSSGNHSTEPYCRF
jgi:hypothetical protein